MQCRSIAALKADVSDIKAIAQSIEEMQLEVSSGRFGTQGDTSFHMAIAYAAKNPIHILIMRNFYDYLHQNIRENLKSLYEIPGNTQIIMKHHKNILAAITERNADNAFAAMKTHIKFVINFFNEK